VHIFHQNITALSRKLLIVFSIIIFIPFLEGEVSIRHSLLSEVVYESFMDYVYGFSFPEADSMLQKLEKHKDINSVIPTMKYNYAWWAILSGYNVEENIKKCNVQTDKTISYLNRLDNPGVDQQINLINAYILKVRLESYLNNKVSTIPILFKALNRIKDLINNSDNSDSRLLILGLYYYFVDYIDDKYVLAGPILKKYPKGNRDLGLKYLRKCLESENHLVEIEANYFLYKIYFDLEKKYQSAFINIDHLHKVYPNNLVFSYELFKTMKRMENNKANSLKNEVLSQIYSSETLVISQKTHFISLFNQYDDNR